MVLLEHALVSAQTLHKLLAEPVPLVVLPLAIVRVVAARVDEHAVAVALVIFEIANVSYQSFFVLELAKTVPLPVLELPCVLEN